MLDMRKLLLCCVCSVAMLASFAAASNDMFVNGSFNGNDTGWTFLPLSNAQGFPPDPAVLAGYYAPEGMPVVGCALLQNVGSNTNNYRYFQTFAVTEGHTYYLRGQWKGNILGNVTDDPCAPSPQPNARNWAELYIVFTPTAPTSDSTTWGSGNILYKKRIGPGTLSGLVNVAANGQWGWESILASPNVADATPGPTDGVFTITNTTPDTQYMTVAFNIGGRASSVGSNDITNSKSVWYMVDNMHLCDGATYMGDINGDCKVNFLDLKLIADQWVGCGIDPASSCW
jgi:hypothetical protein